MGLDLSNLKIYKPLLFMTCIFTVDCGPPFPPINGNVGHYSSTKERTNVTFQCYEGHVPSIMRIATCNNFGMWSPAPQEHSCTLIEGIYICDNLILYMYYS